MKPFLSGKRIAISGIVIASILTVVVTYWVVNHSDYLFFKGDQPKVEVDSMYFITGSEKVPQSFAFKIRAGNASVLVRSDSSLILEAPLVIKLKANKSIRKISKAFASNRNYKFDLRDNILTGELKVDTSINKLQLTSKYEDSYFKANEYIIDTFNVKLEFNYHHEMKNYYIHYLLLYQSDAGGIYDIYYTRVLKVEKDDTFNPSHFELGYTLSDKGYPDTKLYSDSEFYKFVEFFEKTYGVKIK